MVERPRPYLCGGRGETGVPTATDPLDVGDGAQLSLGIGHSDSRHAQRQRGAPAPGGGHKGGRGGNSCRQLNY